MGYSPSGFKLASVEPSGILKRKRLRLGLTQQQVADKAGIHQQQYQKFENGDRDITNSSFYTACKVIEALDMDISSFYHGKYSWDDSDDKSSQEKAGSDSQPVIPTTPITRLYFIPNINATPQQKIDITIADGKVELNPLTSFCFLTSLSFADLAKTHGFPNSKPLTREESLNWIQALNRLDILSWKRQYIPEPPKPVIRSIANMDVEFHPSYADSFEEARAVGNGVCLNWSLEIERSDRKRAKYISGYGIYPAGFESFLDLLAIVAPDFRWSIMP